jgi:hypothetical protein
MFYHFRYISAGVHCGIKLVLPKPSVISLLQVVLCAACKSQAYLIVLSPRLSVTDTICLHFHFSVSTPGMGGI